MFPAGCRIEPGSVARCLKVPGIVALLGLLVSPCAALSQSVTEELTDSRTGHQLIKVAGGCFLMGVDASEVVPPARGDFPRVPRADEVPRHEVCLDSFLIGKYEVTWGRWRSLVAGIDYYADDADQQPVRGVTLGDIDAYLFRLNDQKRQETDGLHLTYRLPTEAEWEYACRAGNNDPIQTEYTDDWFAWLQTQAWFRSPERSLPTSRVVGEMAANAWGIHDMLGNVWEWTGESYLPDGYAQHVTANPKVSGDADRAVIRGGGFKSNRWFIRCGARNYALGDDPLESLGFRVVAESRLTSQ